MYGTPINSAAILHGKGSDLNNQNGGRRFKNVCYKGNSTELPLIKDRRVAQNK